MATLEETQERRAFEETMQLLETIRSTGLPIGQVKKDLQSLGEQGLSAAQHQALLGSPARTKLLAAAKLNLLHAVDILRLERVLGLVPESEGELVPLLRFSGTIRVPPREYPHSPKMFFKSRKGLRVLEPGSTRVLQTARDVEWALPALLTIHTLTRPASDGAILHALPRQPVVELHHLSRLLELKSMGFRGQLVDGRAIMSFVRVGSETLIFELSYHSQEEEWLVDAWELGEKDTLPEGTCILSFTVT